MNSKWTAGVMVSELDLVAVGFIFRVTLKTADEASARINGESQTAG
jgi:hypothetical protein